MRISDWSSDVCSSDLFEFPVEIVQRLGLIVAGGDDEVEEAALPEGYEALQLPADGMLRPAELVEDELILAIPVVPVKPGSEAVERDWPVQADEEMRANPFAALKGLKKHRSEEHTSELQSLMRISYAVFCLKKKKHKKQSVL